MASRLPLRNQSRLYTLAALVATVFTAPFLLCCAPGFVQGRAPQLVRAVRVRLRAEEEAEDLGIFEQFAKTLNNAIMDNSYLAPQERDAYNAYRKGSVRMDEGDYSSALAYFAEALRHEEDPIDRSFVLYHLGFCFDNSGEYVKAVKYYNLALEHNTELPQAYNNAAIIYHSQGARAERRGEVDKSLVLFDRAAQYWAQAIRLRPGDYTKAESWMKETGYGSAYIREDN